MSILGWPNQSVNHVNQALLGVTKLPTCFTLQEHQPVSGALATPQQPPAGLMQANWAKQQSAGDSQVTPAPNPMTLTLARAAHARQLGLEAAKAAAQQGQAAGTGVALRHGTSFLVLVASHTAPHANYDTIEQTCFLRGPETQC